MQHASNSHHKPEANEAINEVGKRREREREKKRKDAALQLYIIDGPELADCPFHVHMDVRRRTITIDDLRAALNHWKLTRQCVVRVGLESHFIEILLRERYTHTLLMLVALLRPLPYTVGQSRWFSSEILSLLCPSSQTLSWTTLLCSKPHKPIHRCRGGNTTASLWSQLHPR
ncbi:hypothetical protein BO86DRAFT_37048 [Aspergillus japonicus CBS 114.51]|uniref:Uncharacterized protein n=1 Tax=Aspergillus japonicus CBS 114.51 TaxID=1448312 RepID=A0A8T8WJW0_ASPJA|nr:hypothetical protein BO86DRAFT_37048 [Aspergillus japonicus CBS 114.51]RAH76016.1 hypothetical protein BO86DRAFT_37048 [Aspergillus japonicus CBS 114.51]